MDTGISKRGSCLTSNYENYSSLLNHTLNKKRQFYTQSSHLPSVKQLVAVDHYVNKRRDTSSNLWGIQRSGPLLWGVKQVMRTLLFYP